MDGLLTLEEKEQLIEQILAKQQAGGGWSLGVARRLRPHGEIKTRSRRPMAMPPD